MSFMTTLHLMVGLPCSGKTTYAKQLAAKEQAMLFSPDVWQRRLFGGVYRADADLDTVHTNIELIMWDVAAQVLSRGISVILDFGFWSRKEREEFRNRAKGLSVCFQIHYMDVPKEELFRRLRQRNANKSRDSIVFSPESLEEWYDQFEVPVEAELDGRFST